MKHILILKLIARNWWRNKFFMLISLLSLAVGISCVNMLITYVIHENNVEPGNTKKNRIIYLTQDSPFMSGSQISFIAQGVPSLMKDKYPGIDATLQIQHMDVSYAMVEEGVFEDVSLMGTDPTLPEFFTYETLSGDMVNVLSKPGMIALTQHAVKRMFGEQDPIGRLITFHDQENGNMTFEIGAVLKDYTQSFLKFDALTLSREDSYGGISLLLVGDGIDADQLIDKINQDKDISKLKFDDGNYYYRSIQEAAFHPLPQENMKYINYRQKELTAIGFIAALLILVIACFNYINMLLSRTFKQVRQIYIKKLMGATNADIRYQMFANVFLTMLIAFLISLLLIHDFLPSFNTIMQSNLSPSFFFHSEVLWVLILFLVILSLIPSLYISRRLSRLSLSDYNLNYTGKRKHMLISVMVIIQFVFSIGLLLATTVVNGQLRFTENMGKRFQNVIEVGSHNLKLTNAFKQEIEKLPGVLSATESFGRAMEAGIVEMPLFQPDGSEIYQSVQQHKSGKNILETYSIDLLHGDLETALFRSGRTVLINETFMHTVIPQGINPVGRKWSEFTTLADSVSIIAGVVEDFATMPVNLAIRPTVISVYIEPDKFSYLSIKLDGTNNDETLEMIKSLWQRFQYGVFQFQDVYQSYMDRNRKITSLNNLLNLYSAISICLTFLGLFGIIWYSVKQRTREIGIRKINGANTNQIMILLMKPYILQILIAYAIAWPITVYLLHQWLEQFVYRTDMDIFDFMLPLIAVLVITAIVIIAGGWKIANRNPVDTIKGD